MALVQRRPELIRLIYHADPLRYLLDQSQLTGRSRFLDFLENFYKFRDDMIEKCFTVIAEMGCDLNMCVDSRTVSRRWGGTVTEKRYALDMITASENGVLLLDLFIRNGLTDFTS